MSEPKTLVFDIEANGFLPKVNKVHCIGALDPLNGEQWSWGPNELSTALEYLDRADCLVAHNGIGYDLPVLKKVLGYNTRPGIRRLDTLVTARLLHGDLKNEDLKRQDFPSRLIGSHSLKAWGIRLGEFKGEYGYTEDGKPIEGIWETWTQEMQDYMDQDVRVNLRLLQALRPWEYPRVPLDLEHRKAEVCFAMETEGWPFDQKKAQDLYVELVTRRDEVEKQLVETFGSWQEVDKIITPKRDNKKLGYVNGVPVTKYKEVVFNPGSRVHIEKKLTELGWKPQEFTESGRAKLDEEILLKIDLPEAKQLVEYLLVQKRLGQIGDGDNGWLKVVKDDGCIHARYNPCGTITGRATHYTPNISQVPAVRAPYGKECRSLFHAPQGWKLVGADMSGLELRCLANYLAFNDKGEYGRIVTGGDVHTVNQKAMGLETRDQAKTACYAILYGCGDAKCGKIVNGTAKQGKAIKDNWKKNIPALGMLMKAVVANAGKGWLKGLDGRKLSVRSDHAALNVLLQGAGAVLCGTWLVNTFDALKAQGYKHGWDGDFVFCGWIHDEIQVACREDLTDIVGDIIVSEARKAGEPYDFKVPLDSSYVVGSNWAETH